MTAAFGYTLIAAAFEAPLQAVRKRWPSVAHAVTMEGVFDGWQRGTYTSACGLTGLRLSGMNRGEGVGAVPWPPRIKGMPEGMVRCRDCWLATGKMRPRTEWRAAS